MLPGNAKVRICKNPGPHLKLHGQTHKKVFPIREEPYMLSEAGTSRYCESGAGYGKLSFWLSNMLSHTVANNASQGRVTFGREMAPDR